MVDYYNYIPTETYLKDPFDVAQKHLLGAYLCSDIGGVFTAGKITELEVYIGAYDKACHAYLNKKTIRNQVMFASGGRAYVFFVYGMYHQFNVVVSPQGEANAILIRSLEPVAGLNIMQQRRKTTNIKNLTTGPGKLCQALGINTQEHNGLLLHQSPIWIAKGEEIRDIVATTRVGIDYAEEYKDKPWRFYLKNSQFISKK